VQTGTVAEGSHAIRHDFTSGQSTMPYVTQHFGDAADGPVWSTGEGSHFTDFYISYRFRYSNGFNFNDNYKQFIIGTQDDRTHANVCCNPWVSHYLTIYIDTDLSFRVEGNNKQSEGTQWFELSPNTGGYSLGSPFTIATNTWYKVVVRRRINDSGVDNGIFQLWIDDVLVGDYSTVRYAIPWNGTVGANFTYGTNFVMLSDYSSSSVPQNQSVYYDSIKFSATAL
jgi:hypothetical protein